MRVLEISPNRWLVVADAPLARFGERAINSRLSNLEWVARCAVAHEAVVESFIKAPAVLPMKLFTIFASDERALEHVRGDSKRIEMVLDRVRNQHEWGVRVVFDRAPSVAAPVRRGADVRGRPTKRATGKPQPARMASGIGYLARKKAQRDSAAELVNRAREAATELYDRLERQAHLARRRTPGQPKAEGAPMLLDAVFLVPSSRAPRFRTAVVRAARDLQQKGYRLTVTGPWPPYSFVQD